MTLAPVRFEGLRAAVASAPGVIGYLGRKTVAGSHRFAGFRDPASLARSFDRTLWA
jgi:hypothetical protein